MTAPRDSRAGVGLAIIGCGTTGRIRAMLARESSTVRWLGLCDLKRDLADALAADTAADYVTTDLKELLDRPEVTAAVVATDENEHVAPVLAALDHGHSLLIEKPLATDPVESEQVLRRIEKAGVDAVVGYSQRFRRRFLAARRLIHDGQIGEVTTVVTRAFMNRMVPIATLRRTDATSALTPMVVSGTHSLDICLWLLDGLPGKRPVEVYAKGAGYQPKGFEAGAPRHVDFIGSYPPGDLHDGMLWGPMREETSTWLTHLVTGARTPHATAAEAHRNLLLTMAMDTSARSGRPVALPADPVSLRPPKPRPAGMHRGL